VVKPVQQEQLGQVELVLRAPVVLMARQVQLVLLVFQVKPVRLVHLVSMVRLVPPEPQVLEKQVLRELQEQKVKPDPRELQEQLERLVQLEVLE